MVFRVVKCGGLICDGYYFMFIWTVMLTEGLYDPVKHVNKRFCW